MSESTRSAYVPRPHGSAKKLPSWGAPAAGAGALAAGLIWVLAPGFNQAPEAAPAAPAAPAIAAPAAPSAPAAKAEAAPRITVQTSASVAAKAVAGSEGGVERAAVAKPAWATADVVQQWAWPRKLELQGDGLTVDRRLSAWFPNNPENKRFQYSLTVDKNETRLFEDEIPAFAREIQRQERERLAAQAAAEAAERAEKAKRDAQRAEFDRQDTARIAAQKEWTARQQAAKAEAAPAPAPAQAQARGGYRPAYGPSGRRPGTAPAAVPVAAMLAPAPGAAQAGQAGGAVAGIALGAGAFAAGGAGVAQGAGDALPPAMPGRLGALWAAMQERLGRGQPLTREDWNEYLEEVRRMELEAMVAGSKGKILSARAVESKDGQPMAELTMADGTTKVVPYDPLVFDLKGTGIRTTSKKVLFDLYGHGKAERTQWMNDLDDGVGVLVFDAKGTGTSGKNGSEVFGDRTDLEGVGRPGGFANGFEALWGLVNKAVKEGVLPRSVVDTEILDSDALAKLEKAYGLKMKVGGLNKEAVSLAKAGVKSIALSRAPVQRAADFDGQQNDVMMQPGAVFQRADGTAGTYMNVWLSAKQGNLGLKTVKSL